MRNDTEKAIKEYGTSTFLFKKIIEEAEKLISDSEKVILVITANFGITYPDPTKKDAGAGVVFVTDNRMLIYHKPLHEGISFIVPLSEIKEIKLVKNVMNGSDNIQVYTSDAIYNFPLSIKEKSFSLSSKQAAANKIYRAFLFAKNPTEFAK